MRKNLAILFLVFISTFFLMGFDHSAEKSKKLKIYISVDMEGIGSLVTSAQLGPGGFEYEKGRKLMTAEVNAAIEGCLEAGAGEIVVSDSHGNAQNLIPDQLNKSAFLIRGFPRTLLQMEGIDSSFDGVIFIGYHPKEGTPNANLSHTIWGSKFNEIKVNGIIVSEAIFNAAVAGHFGVPVIMVAGDQNVVEEALKTFGNIETVKTKESLGYYSAKFRHPEIVCNEIKEKCKRAVQRINEFKPFVIKPPIKMEITFKRTYDAEAFSYLPWVKRISGKTILVETDNILDANRFITAVFSINNK